MKDGGYDFAAPPDLTLNSPYFPSFKEKKEIFQTMWKDNTKS